MRFSKTQTITIILPFKCTHFLCFVTQIKFVLCRFFLLSHMEKSRAFERTGQLVNKNIFPYKFITIFWNESIKLFVVYLYIINDIKTYIRSHSIPVVSLQVFTIYANSLGIECQYWEAVAPQ